MATAATRTRLLVLLIFAAMLLPVSLLVWKLKRPTGPVQENNAATAPPSNNSPAPSETTAATPAAIASPSSSASPTPSDQSTATPSPPNLLNAPSPQITGTPAPAAPAPTPDTQAPTQSLIIPVVGIGPEQLQDTYTASRSAGRTHDAIDIIAPRGTPVMACADGQIVKLFLSKPGGITIYQLSTDQKRIYYYAHLERYADGLAEGHFARQGEVIAYVGDTGNAGPGNYHLHFSIMLISDPKRYWQGVNINPYPLLKK